MGVFGGARGTSNIGACRTHTHTKHTLPDVCVFRSSPQALSFFLVKSGLTVTEAARVEAQFREVR